jgi:hypothetical protein
MPYIPGVLADVFISYAHRDNQDGWVSRLHGQLTRKLNLLLPPAIVYFDNRLREGVYFKDEIQQQLTKTAIFIAVVSPSYLNSQFTIVDELDWYQNQGGKDIIQLLLVPLDADQQVPFPEIQYGILHDPDDGHPLSGETLDRKLDDLTSRIATRLRELVELPPKIYVAQLRNDPWKNARDGLTMALHSNGYAILPKGNLPLRVPDSGIRGPLQNANLSVQWDGVPGDSLALRQLEIARQIGRPTVILSEPPTKDQVPALVANLRSRIDAGRKPAVYLIYDSYSDRARVAPLPA